MNCPLCYLKLRAKLVDGVWKMFCKCGFKPHKSVADSPTEGS